MSSPQTPDAGRTSRGSRHRGDEGVVTAETAVVLPVLFLVLALGVFVLQVLGAQLRCTDAAGLAARAAARGDARDAVVATGRTLAPDGAQVQVDVGDEQVTVTVVAQVQPLGSALSWLPDVRVQARSVAAREDRVEP